MPGPRAGSCARNVGETLASGWMRASLPSVVEGSGSGWVIRLCGTIEVRAGDRALGGALPGRQGRLLLAYLTVNRDRSCRRTELIDVLWPEAPPAAADAALSALLSKLRRTLGDGRAGRALGGPAHVCGRRSPSTSSRQPRPPAGPRRRCTTATGARPRAAARDALAAGNRGAFLPDCDGPWLNEQRGALEGLRVRALEVLAEASLRAGAPAEAADGGARRRDGGAVPRVRPRPADGSPRRGRQPGGGAARVRRPAAAAAGGARHRPRARRDGAARARAARPRAGRPERRAAPPPAIVARRWPAPLDAARGRHDFVGRAAEAALLGTPGSARWAARAGWS